MALAHSYSSKLSMNFDSAELTEAIVLTRTRAPDLDSVKKLNCWASNISGVSVVRQMPALEVCSLSINKITSLRDFAHCYNLKELYVRTNKIERLGDIHYLKHLSKLRSLWLSENPCASEPNYRMTVLRTLPNLRKLDNIAVTEEEIHRAETEGSVIPIPEDFSSSSLFNVEAFTRSNSKPTASPPDSARSIDSTKTVTGSVLNSVGVSIETDVGGSVNASGSDGKWALPRRKRQQRKRDEMMRSSAGEVGGGSARSGEDSSGPGDGKGNNQVSGSSDSPAEKDNDSGCNGKGSSDDENSEKAADEEKDVEVTKETLQDSAIENRNIIGSSIRCSASSEEDKSNEETRMNGQYSDKRNAEESCLQDRQANSDAEAGIESPLGTNPDFLPVTDCAGSINVLRISDSQNTVVSEPPLSSNSTLIETSEVPRVEDKSNSNNNSNNNNTQNDISKDTNLNEIVELQYSVANEFNSNPIPANPSVSNPVKLNEHSLLDQIRLDDSLDVLDSAAEENHLPEREVVTSIDLEHLEVEINPVPMSSDLLGSRQSGINLGNSSSAGATTANNRREKPSLPSKPKRGQVNMEELNRMRAELGIRPMSNTRSSTPSSNADTSVVKNSNVLQAVLCLLKELDKESLEVVDTAVKARLEDLK